MPLLRRRLPSERLTQRYHRDPQVRVLPHRKQAQVVWRFSDGKPGHDNQSLGLVDALQRRIPIDIYDIPVRPGAGIDWMIGRFPAGSLLPDPWLILGAGHSTHLPLLAARRARGGRAAVLMTPDLPKSMFDLCVIPEHDRPKPASNILVTRGSLNRMQATSGEKSDQGLLLIGGPSRHYHWNYGVVLEQISRVIHYSPVKHWVLTTSRRTPAGFAERVRQKIYNRNLELSIFSWRDTTEQWLSEQLDRACCAWITEDSVSMIYEALTARIPVGLLAVPPRRNDRVVRGVRNLVATSSIRTFSDWSAGHPLSRTEYIYDEANRVAAQICDQWGNR